MRNTFFILTIAFLTVLSGAEVFAESYSQEVVDKVKIELSGPELSAIEESENMITQAFDATEEANRMDIDFAKYRAKADARRFKWDKRIYQRKMRRVEKRVVEKRLNALAQFDTAYGQMHQIFEKHLARIRPTDSPACIELGERLEKEAAQHFGTARSLRYQVAEHRDSGQLKEMSAEITQLEELGINKLLKAFGVYLNWPEVTAEFSSEFSPDTKNMESHTPSVVVETAPIVFSVQIVAGRSKFDNRQIAAIYPGPKTVTEHYENGWYKYTVGSFSSYDAATRLKDEIKIFDAFIAAHKNSKRMDIREAILESSQ